MAKFFGKKQLVLGTLIVALGVAVYLNYYLAQGTSLLPDAGSSQTQNTAPDKELGDALNVNASTGKTETGTSVYFDEARRNRETSRQEAAELVREILNDVKATDEQKQTVAVQVAAMAKAIEQESKIEELVKAKGFSDCVAYIEGEKCSIVIKSDGLTIQDTAKISQIVTTQSHIDPQNINIVTVK